MDRPDSQPSSSSSSGRHTASDPSDPISKDAIAVRISSTITEVLTAFVRQELNLDPVITNLLHIWECAWEDRAGELSVFLHGNDASDNFHLRLFYIEKIDKPPSKALQPSDIQRLAALLQERTGLEAKTHA